MVDVSKTLQVALQQLRAERVKLDRQIAALERAVDGTESTRARRAGAVRKAVAKAGRTRRPMSAAARKAISRRMKQYWAARRKAQ